MDATLFTLGAALRIVTLTKAIGGRGRALAKADARPRPTAIVVPSCGAAPESSGAVSVPGAALRISTRLVRTHAIAVACRAASVVAARCTLRAVAVLARFASTVDR